METEFGTVTHVGVNQRGNRYGFVVTPDGVSVYFNNVGGYHKLVATDNGARFPIGWGEFIGAGPRQRSPFPKVGQALAFVRRRPSMYEGPNAWMWCLASRCRGDHAAV